MSAILELNPETIEETVANTPAVLVDFWGEWCQPCKAMVPTLEAIAAEQEGVLTVAKMDIGAFPEMTKQYKINGVPHLILFQDGEIIARITGAQPKEKLLSVILPLLEDDEEIA